MENLIPKKDAARILGISTKTLDRIVAEERLTPCYIRSKVLFKASELDKFMAGRGRLA